MLALLYNECYDFTRNALSKWVGANVKIMGCILMNWSIVFNVLLVILAIVLGVLYYSGQELEKRQVETQATIDAAKQVVTLMAIDKKKMKIKEAGLPAIVYEQTP